MKLKYLGVTQDVYRKVSVGPQVKTMSITRGAIVEFTQEEVDKLMRDYPKDWEPFDASPVEPVETLPEHQDQQGDESPWTKKKSKAK